MSFLKVLGCTPGRSSEHWADYSIFGHQLVLHEDKSHKGYKYFNEVDGRRAGATLWRGFGLGRFQNFSQHLTDQTLNFKSPPPSF